MKLSGVRLSVCLSVAAASLLPCRQEIPTDIGRRRVPRSSGRGAAARRTAANCAQFNSKCVQCYVDS